MDKEGSWKEQNKFHPFYNKDWHCRFDVPKLLQSQKDKVHVTNHNRSNLRARFSGDRRPHKRDEIEWDNEADYKISHFDMGPFNLEGEAYHANFLVNALIKRARELNKKNLEIKDQMQPRGILCHRLWALSWEKYSSSSQQKIDSNTLNKVKGNIGSAQAVYKWADSFYQCCLSYIKVAIDVTNERKELVTKLQQMSKEQGRTFILSREVADILAMNHMILVAEKIIENPRCLPYGVNSLMHTDNRKEHVTQQYSFYYSHICQRDYIVLPMMNTTMIQSCTYTIPKNLPEGAHRLHNNYRLHANLLVSCFIILPTTLESLILLARTL